MITCQQLVDLLIDYVSDELPADHKSRIDQHLKRCPPCLTYLETYRATIRLTRQLPCPSLPPELVKKLRAAAEDICRAERAREAQRQPPPAP
jgi:anti-sigma factor RsiW